MDWRSAEQRLVRGITDLQEELTMWQPDLVSAVAVLEPVDAIPLEVQLRAEVAAPHRDRVSLYAAAAFTLENSGLVATADVNLDQVEPVDAQIAPGDYLYGTTDFRAWLSDLDGKRD